MEYGQERVTTLHDLADADPPAAVDRAAVVVPMTEREYGGLAAERVLSELEAVGPERVVVPLRASPDRVGPFRAWLDEFDLPLVPLWCDGPRLSALLADSGLDGDRGKGRDVWLGVGLALDADHVVLQDADARAYTRTSLHRLLFPLDRGFELSKGYYARVENSRLYGRLCRLFYDPLVRALAERHRAPVVEYLGAFRYALAGEFALTAGLARRVRIQRQWGLEVGTLGDAFGHAGFEGSAQVDLGRHEHDHRSVGGPTGLSEMSQSVAAALFRTVTDHGVEPEYATLTERYTEVAGEFVRAYEADAAFNGLSYDRGDELEQVETYAEAVCEPGPDRRLPAWRDAPLDPDAVRTAAREDLEETA